MQPQNQAYTHSLAGEYILCYSHSSSLDLFLTNNYKNGTRKLSKEYNAIKIDAYRNLRIISYNMHTKTNLFLALYCGSTISRYHHAVKVDCNTEPSISLYSFSDTNMNYSSKIKHHANFHVLQNPPISITSQNTFAFS